jgi:hypothetical protein
VLWLAGLPQSLVGIRVQCVPCYSEVWSCRGLVRLDVFVCPPGLIRRFEVRSSVTRATHAGYVTWALGGLLMLYRCSSCESTQWRGYFPATGSHVRYVIFHGIAIGICGVATKVLFLALGQSIVGWLPALASLGMCTVFLGLFYSVALIVEALCVATLPCISCGRNGLQLHD